MENSHDDNFASKTTEQQVHLTTRLAALNRWQAEQQRLLEERQSKQREMLNMEQRNLYEMLGLLQSKVSSKEDALDDDSNLEADEQIPSQLSIQMPRLSTGPTKDSNLHDVLASSDLAKQPKKAKKPFLRRGEGLKQRFNIDPDNLRLDNLPRYKFANSHPHLKAPVRMKPKGSILKTQSENQKNTKVGKHLEPAAAVAIDPPQSLDFNEHRFQQLLINSKHAQSSTPDLKSSYTTSTSTTTTNSSVSPKVQFMELKSMEHSKGQSADDEGSSVASAMTGICWAKVLDSQQIKPCPVLQQRNTQIRVEDDSNVSIFELLEQKAREGNIDMNSSCIRAFMSRKERRQNDDTNDSDQIVITQQLKHLRLEPQICDIPGDIVEDDDADGDGDGENANSTLTLTPIQVGKTQVRVRFSDSNDTHEYTDETVTDTCSTLQNSCTDNKQLFDQFKSVLFQALDKRKSETQSSNLANEELQAKADLVRKRLEELEHEILNFKEQNTQLLRMKQQHELEHAKRQEEHLQAMEQVHDEKIQAEIYLHDERMKIEEERRKFEQQMRLQKSNVNSKEKKEIAALKQEVEALQLQLKQKEQTHVSAQARLRAQLRASEKEQNGFRDEIELLRRENRRLEQEIIKSNRDTSNKMLQEINRNIARLAPSVTAPVVVNANTTDENGRRTKSLDGPGGPKMASKKRNSTCQQQPDNSNKSKENRSRSRSLGRLKQPTIREPSPSSSSSSGSCESILQVEFPTEQSKKKTPSADEQLADNTSEFKREIVNADGSKDIWYPNGNLKKISADGMTVRMLYFNKDIKETDIRAGTVKYYYAETNTWHTSYLDGLEILEFPNGQTEHRHKNGVVEIHFPNNTIKVVDPNDEEKLEEWRYADGSHLVQLRNGDKILHLPNGQKEIHTKLNKRREYPDGTVKLVYPDGSQESRYSNGRVRLKDKDGKLIMDTDYSKFQ